MTDRSVYVHQGKVEVSNSPNVYMTTVLGSCVSACVWDEKAQIGGMNHLLLPPGNETASGAMGVHLMELLINGLLRRGAEKENIKVLLFGGARMVDGLSDIGQRNAEFARTFFSHEGIAVEGGSLGGTKARRVQFWPATGRARQKTVNEPVVEQKAPPPPPPAGGDIELF